MTPKSPDSNDGTIEVSRFGFQGEIGRISATRPGGTGELPVPVGGFGTSEWFPRVTDL